MIYKQSNKRPSSNYRQQGGTMWSLLFNCALILFFLYVGSKMVPAYSAGSAVKVALEQSLDNVASLQSFRERDLVNNIAKRLYIDGVTGIEFQEALTIEKAKNLIVANIRYEEKIHLFYNIGIYLEFDIEAKKRF